MKKLPVEYMIEAINEDCLNSTFITPDIVVNAKFLQRELIIQCVNEAIALYELGTYDKVEDPGAEYYNTKIGNIYHSLNSKDKWNNSK